MEEVDIWCACGVIWLFLTWPPRPPTLSQCLAPQIISAKETNKTWRRISSLMYWQLQSLCFHLSEHKSLTAKRGWQKIVTRSVVFVFTKCHEIFASKKEVGVSNFEGYVFRKMKYGFEFSVEIPKVFTSVNSSVIFRKSFGLHTKVHAVFRTRQYWRSLF